MTESTCFPLRFAKLTNFIHLSDAANTVHTQKSLMLPDGKRGKTDLNVSTAAYGQAEVTHSRNPGKEREMKKRILKEK
jgi:hypothetical protein